jgi:hypothetical protein
MQKDVFWKSAVLTFVVLAAGIQLGIWIDSGRIDGLKQSLTQTDIQFSDARLQAAYLENFLHGNGNGAFCESALRSNLEFNDRIYEQGKQLERYELVDRFNSESLKLERQRYALLQFQFWMNALKIKEICGFDYNTVLYVYRSNTENVTEMELPQKLQSVTLLELKEKCGPQLMLSPVPLDLGLTSIDIIVQTYDIGETPALVINNGTVMKGLAELSDLEEIIEC